METPSDEIMCNTRNAIFLLFIYNIKITLSGILNPEKMELNIGKLEMKNQRDTFSIKDVKSSNTFKYSEVTCKSN